MAIDFPNTPNPGDTFTSAGVTWQWDGTKWNGGATQGNYVTSWNTRAGAVTLQQADITAVGALHDVGRNLLHNSLFNVAQRGGGPFTTTSYTYDRWQLINSGDTVSISHPPLADSDRAQIGDEAAIYCVTNTFTGAAGAGAVNFLQQPIEGVRRLSSKTVTVSCWAKGVSGATRLGVNLMQSFGTGGSPSAALWATGQSVTLTATWTRYSVSFAIPSTVGKTVGTNGDDATELAFFFSSGATNNVVAGNIGVQSGIIQLWGIQLEVGSVATPLEKPDPQQDLAKCQRFFLASGPLGFNGYNAAGWQVAQTWFFPVQMRAAPTLSLSTTDNNNAGPVSVPYVSPTTVKLQITATAAGPAYWDGNFTASADL
jgi:hypothetical protein